MAKNVCNGAFRVVMVFIFLLALAAITFLYKNEANINEDCQSDYQSAHSQLLTSNEEKKQLQEQFISEKNSHLGTKNLCNEKIENLKEDYEQTINNLKIINSNLQNQCDNLTSVNKNLFKEINDIRKDSVKQIISSLNELGDVEKELDMAEKNIQSSENKLKEQENQWLEEKEKLLSKIKIDDGIITPSSEVTTINANDKSTTTAATELDDTSHSTEKNINFLDNSLD